MRYFQVSPSAKEHHWFALYLSQEDAWEQHREAIEALIGCDADDNLAFDVTQLGLRNVPDVHKKQFRAKPERGIYWSKENSKLKKEWVKLASDLQLPCLTELKLFLFLNTNIRPDTPKMLGMYNVGGSILVVGDDHENWKQYAWAEEITERHFLTLYQPKEGVPRDVLPMVSKA